MSRKLRVAIIGCGRISVAYEDAFKRLSSISDIVFAVDIEEEKAKEFAKKFDCEYSTDYKDIFSKNIDVVHLCLPHYLHAPVAIDCLDHGINVLTEKPMALSLQEADMMIEASKRNNKLLGCIFQTRYNESVHILKKMVVDGEFGKIKSIRSLLTWSRDKEYYSSSNWKGTWDKEGGGVLIDQAIHSLDRVLYLAGDDVEWVEANIANRVHPFVEVEDVAEATIKFKNGIIYSLYATDSFFGDDTPINIDFCCEKGMFGLHQDVGYSLVGSDYKEYREIEEREVVGKGYWGTTHVMQLHEFYNAVLNGTPILVDMYQGRKTLEVVKAIYKSAMEKKKIYLPFVDSKIQKGTKL